MTKLNADQYLDPMIVLERKEQARLTIDSAINIMRGKP